ncbi:TPA: glycosyl transferase [Clostridium perfringens]|uniref:ATP-grasp fold amidoligase family protein n=3 Tax=Clostridium perfringens TaxID=1502 RepID=UPI001A22107D|nr:ATP-grasp fold amidoligase family protein [Clostridium perfringens]EIF6165031.1 glycosyl transferase [Clostridium perfringens]EIF6166389.1 glycosyl transferase [Clostridium perfringens]EJT6151355.1 glycosyl transferase [Clostridium perfringens]EJT6157040.1 glycosyl transferase [Clostridium perfringens]ELC8344932.1 glycosyl transferase [Clostridium perfringens]
MERDSLLYKTRRTGQVIAHKIFPNEVMSKIYFKIVLGKKLNLDSPQTFNEKIQWLKLYYFPKSNSVVKCADKYAVRDYIKNKGYENTLTPLIGSWNNTSEIDWDILPKKFVFKCNHGCAYNIVVTNKEKVDKSAIIKQLNTWMKEDFGAFNIELHYSKIKPRKIICEEFLGENITDYKFFCFNGEPKYIYVSNDLIHDRQAQIGFFYLDGSKMPLTRDDYTDIPEVKLPRFYNEMLEMSKALSKDFPFVRVDFFIANNRYYFAELTFTPGAGMMPFNPEKYDLEWGKMIDLSSIINKVEGN